MQLRKVSLSLISLGVVGSLAFAPLFAPLAVAAEPNAKVSEQNAASDDSQNLDQALSNFKSSAQTLVNELANSSKASFDEAKKNAQETWKNTEASLNAAFDETSKKLSDSTAKTLNYLSQTSKDLAASLKSKSPAEKQAIVNLDASLRQMVALTANFNQEVYADSGEVLSRSSGDLALQRPSQFIMNTIEPDKIILYTKDNAIYYYDDAVNQVTIYSMDMLKHNPFLLLIEQNSDVWDDFTVSQDGERYTLVPKASQDIKSLTLSFAPYTLKDEAGNSRRVLDSITIRMNDGNTNFYHFSSQKSRVEPHRFEVILPSGVEYNDERS